MSRLHALICCALLSSGCPQRARRHMKFCDSREIGVVCAPTGGGKRCFFTSLWRLLRARASCSGGAGSKSRCPYQSVLRNPRTCSQLCRSPHSHGQRCGRISRIRRAREYNSVQAFSAQAVRCEQQTVLITSCSNYLLARLLRTMPACKLTPTNAIKIMFPASQNQPKDGARQRAANWHPLQLNATPCS